MILRCRLYMGKAETDITVQRRFDCSGVYDIKDIIAEYLRKDTIHYILHLISIT